MTNQLEKAWLPIAAAMGLALPLAMPKALGYETNTAFLLAPFVAWAILKHRDCITMVFVASILCGLSSILIASRIGPDGRLLKDFLSILLLIFSAGFYFLGREIKDVRRLVYWLAVLSAVFVIPASMRLLIFGQPGRVAVDNMSYFYSFFFGWPTVSNHRGAVPQMVCILAALLCGVLLGGLISRIQRWIFTTALACATHLIVGSNFPSAIMAFVLLTLATAIFVSRHRATLVFKFASIILAMLIGSTAALMMHTESQFAKKITDVDAIGRSPMPSAPSKVAPIETLNTITSERIRVAKLVIAEFLASPIVGSGFSPFGRSGLANAEGTMSLTPHVYYLTILQKGGLLFAMPFFTFLVMAALTAIRSGKWRTSPEAALAWIAVAITFGPLSFAYDTPNIPLAGALAYLLLGAVGHPFKSTEREHDSRTNKAALVV